MKPIGAFQTTLSIAHGVLLVCCALLLSPIYSTLWLLRSSLIVISCLTSQCAMVMNVLLSSIAGVIWRLLIVTNRISLHLRLKRTGVNIFGT